LPLFTQIPRRGILGNPHSPGPISPGPTGPYPLHRTGYERYSPSFREPLFSEPQLPEMPILGSSRGIKRAEVVRPRPSTRLRLASCPVGSHLTSCLLVVEVAVGMHARVTKNVRTRSGVLCTLHEQAADEVYQTARVVPVRILIRDEVGHAKAYERRRRGEWVQQSS
jgi:hypothetical protein